MNQGTRRNARAVRPPSPRAKPGGSAASPFGLGLRSAAPSPYHQYGSVGARSRPAHRIAFLRFLETESPQRGFTLIELVVAVGIFVLLVGGATGAFVRLTQSQRVDRAQIMLLTDVQNFLETLEREIRTGFGSTFSGEGTTLSLTNQNRESVTYERDDTTTSIKRNSVPITAERTEIRDLDFAVRTAACCETTGSPPLLTAQGLVTVRLRACPKTLPTPAPDTRCLVLQTTLTSRQHAPPL